MRKNLGFELLAKQISVVFQNKQLSSIIFENRSDISRFNYYLNRFDNKFKDKVFLMSKNETPGNFYEANYNINSKLFNIEDKVLLVSKSKKAAPNEAWSNFNLLQKISLETVDDIKRTYYLYTANIIKK